MQTAVGTMKLHAANAGYLHLWYDKQSHKSKWMFNNFKKKSNINKVGGKLKHNIVQRYRCTR